MRTAWISSAAVLLAGCAGVAVSPDPLRGTSGPVAWEIVDLRTEKNPEQREFRWRYTLVLRETAGTGIQFTKLESAMFETSRGPAGAAFRETDFTRRLEANSEMRLNFSPRVFWRAEATGAGLAAGFGRALDRPEPQTIIRRFHGRDDVGKEVRIQVLYTLQPEVEGQRAAAPPPPPRAAPPPSPARSTPDPTRLARAAALQEEAQQLLEDGRYADALPRAREATSIREEGLERDSLDLATSRSTLAEVYRGQGHHAEAEALHAQALAAREKHLGGGHPDVARSLHSLALLQHAQGRYLEAESLLRRAAGILDAQVGKAARDRRLHAEMLENLAKVYRALGKTREAEESQARAAVLWTQQ